MGEAALPSMACSALTRFSLFLRSFRPVFSLSFTSRFSMAAVRSSMALAGADFASGESLLGLDQKLVAAVKAGAAFGFLPYVAFARAMIVWVV